jgi:hypothetical protein
VDTYLGVPYFFATARLPRQQFCDPADGLVGDPFEHLLEKEFGIENV